MPDTKAARWNVPTLIAGLLMGLTTVAHVWGGGMDVFRPIRALVPGAELTLYVKLLWHFVTAFLAISAIVLIWAARDIAGRGQASLVVLVMTAAMGGLFFVYGLTELGTVWIAPQWTVVVIIVALGVWPMRRRG